MTSWTFSELDAAFGTQAVDTSHARLVKRMDDPEDGRIEGYRKSPLLNKGRKNADRLAEVRAESQE